jgi:hypothetical protein
MLASFYSQNDARQVEVVLQVNGSTIQATDCFMQNTQSNNTHTNVNLTTVLNLAVNDYVTAGWVSSTNSGIVLYAAGSRVVFSGHLLS